MSIEFPEEQNQEPAKKRRLILRIFLWSLLLAGAVVYYYFWLWRPIGTGPAGPSVPQSAFAKVWTTRQVLLLGVGDSITAGFGVSDNHSFFDRLITNPDDEFPDMKGLCLPAVLPDLWVENIAVSGSTSIELLETLHNSLKTQNPDTLGLVVMTTGGNDIIHDYGKTSPREGAMYGATLSQARPWIDAFEQRLHAIIDLMEDRFPGGCHIFLADIYDFTDGVGDVRKVGLPTWKDGLAIHGAYNEVIHQVAAQRSSVHLVLVHEEFLGHGIRCRQFWRDHYDPEDPYYWYGDNLEDPNDRGYDAIRRLFLIEIAEAASGF